MRSRLQDRAPVHVDSLFMLMIADAGAIAPPMRCLGPRPALAALVEGTERGAVQAPRAGAMPMMVVLNLLRELDLLLGHAVIEAAGSGRAAAARVDPDMAANWRGLLPAIGVGRRERQAIGQAGERLGRVEREQHAASARPRPTAFAPETLAAMAAAAVALNRRMAERLGRG